MYVSSSWNKDSDAGQCQNIKAVLAACAGQGRHTFLDGSYYEGRQLDCGGAQHGRRHQLHPNW